VWEESGGGEEEARLSASRFRAVNDQTWGWKKKSAASKGEPHKKKLKGGGGKGEKGQVPKKRNNLDLKRC